MDHDHLKEHESISYNYETSCCGKGFCKLCKSTLGLFLRSYCCHRLSRKFFNHIEMFQSVKTLNVVLCFTFMANEEPLIYGVIQRAGDINTCCQALVHGTTCFHDCYVSRSRGSNSDFLYAIRTLYHSDCCDNFQ